MKKRIKLTWYNGVNYYDPGGRRIIELTENGKRIDLIRQPCGQVEIDRFIQTKKYTWLS